MEENFFEYLDDAKIEEDVSDSCDHASAILSCIIDQEMLSRKITEKIKKRVRKCFSFHNLAELVSATPNEVRLGAL